MSIEVIMFLIGAGLLMLAVLLIGTAWLTRPQMRYEEVELIEGTESDEIS